MKRAPLLILTGIALLASISSAADRGAATDAFRRGNAAYEAGNFQGAADAYQSAADQGVSDSRLDYNYGNALFRLNRLGPAILWYERALKLAPDDEDIQFNLRFAQSRVVDKAPDVPVNALTRVLGSLHSSYTLRAGVWAGWALFALVFAGFTAALFLAGALRAAAWTLSGIALCALLAFAPSLAYKIREQESSAHAVVLDPSVDLRSGPGDNYELLLKAHEGTVFEILKREGDWLSVRLPDGRGGFVRATQLGEV